MTYVYKPEKPTLDTLVDDMYDYMAGRGDFEPISKEDIEELAKRLAATIENRFKERRCEIQNHNNQDEFKLRMSNYGLPVKKLWYEANVGYDDFKDNPRVFLNFLIGDIWEDVILFLAKKAGHKVEMEQAEVELDGMVGHMDAVIDGYVVDVKSASPYAYDHKFANGSILEGNDDFAYVPQLRAYGEAVGTKKQAWLVANKANGELMTLKIPETLEYDARAQLAKARAAIAQPNPPSEPCCTPIPHGKSGNMQLAACCRFSPYKHLVWPELRAFKYSTGTVYLTDVVKTPKVEEIDLTEERNYTYGKDD